jgi:rhodanese-related sulfurtransferase
MKQLILIFSLLIGFQSTAQRENFHEMLKTYYKNTIPTLKPADLYQKILSGEKIYILDTRETKEFEVSHIKNAIHVGYTNFDLKITDKLDKNTPVIVYCTIGARSEEIGAKIKKIGFKDVYNLYGGLIYWKNQGYRVIDSNDKPTQKVHVYSKEWGKWLKKGIAVY